MEQRPPLALIGKEMERQAPGWTERGTIRGVLPDGRVIIEIKPDGRTVVVDLDTSMEWKLKKGK